MTGKAQALSTVDPLTGSAEEWKRVPGWEGFYEVSSLGNVRSVDRIINKLDRTRRMSTAKISGRVLKLIDTNYGYYKVDLSRDGNVKPTLVHGLVCEAFHGPRPIGCEVAHGNGDRQDNRQSNLRWATKKDNAADRKAHGSHIEGSQHAGAILTEKDVVEIRASRALAKSGSRESGDISREMAARFGITIHRFYTIRGGRAGHWQHV